MDDDPISVVPAKNCTCESAAAPAVALAVTVTPEPTVTTAPLAGAVSETEGPAAAVTVMLTAEEVTAAPLESITRAESATVPAPDGV